MEMGCQRVGQVRITLGDASLYVRHNLPPAHGRLSAALRIGATE